jgi:3'(2'), 5'-bisphosphate nucleotidase
MRSASSWQTLWVVDPLDGTKEFIKRNGEFTVNIALVHQHRPVLGVVHVPAMGVDYLRGRRPRCVQGRKATRAAPSRSARARYEPVRGSSAAAPTAARCSTATSTSSVRNEIVAMGSSLKFCIVAEGGADVYPRLGPTSEWDTAAAQAVVEAAGGRVVDTHRQSAQLQRQGRVAEPAFSCLRRYTDKTG